MTLTTAEDISIVLSGGSNNLNPNNSIGGDPSSAPIVTSVNNLFDDVTPEEAEDGLEDYRCFYVFNDGPTKVYNVKIFIIEDSPGGGGIELGVQYSDELQRLTISGDPVVGGTMTLAYENKETSAIPFASDMSQWAQNIQLALNGILDEQGDPILTGVIVNPLSSNSQTRIFELLYTNLDSRKKHALLSVADNSLSPTQTITPLTVISGSPVNTVATNIGNDKIPPAAVNFFANTEDAPILIPKLSPEDGFPVWVKRTIPPNTAALANDNATLRIYAESLQG